MAEIKYTLKAVKNTEDGEIEQEIKVDNLTRTEAVKTGKTLQKAGMEVKVIRISATEVDINK